MRRTQAEIEARRAVKMDAMLAAENARLREASEARAARSAGHQVLGACWCCGSAKELSQGLTRFEVGLPLGRIDGVLCRPCEKAWRNAPDPAEAVTRRLWEATSLPGRWGWVPAPSRQYRMSVMGGYVVTADGVPVTEVSWTVASPWAEYTWAYRLRQLRSERSGDKSGDPKPPAKPFGWLR
jgi:hypothetical protein